MPSQFDTCQYTGKAFTDIQSVQSPKIQWLRLKKCLDQTAEHSTKLCSAHAGMQLSVLKASTAKGTEAGVWPGHVILACTPNRMQAPCSERSCTLNRTPGISPTACPLRPNPAMRTSSCTSGNSSAKKYKPHSEVGTYILLRSGSLADQPARLYASPDNKQHCRRTIN